MIHPLRFATAQCCLQLEYRVCRAEKERKKENHRSGIDVCSSILLYSNADGGGSGDASYSKSLPLIPDVRIVRAAACSRQPWAGEGVAPAARGDGAGCWDLSTMGSWELDQWNGFPFSP